MVWLSFCYKQLWYFVGKDLNFNTTVELVRGLVCSRKIKTVPQRSLSIAFDFLDLSSSNLVDKGSVDL